MLVQNISSAAVLEQAGDSAGIPLVITEPLVVKETRQAHEPKGSVGSHLLFGLGTTLFVSPMVIPGIPWTWLVVGYISLVCLAITAAVFWAGFNAMKSRRLRSQHPRRRSSRGLG